jgi:hypothetical protein
LDGIRDVRNNLDGLSQIIASSLFILQISSVIIDSLQNCGIVVVSYNDQLVDLTGGHVTLVAQLNAEISDYYVSNVVYNLRNS